MLAVGATDLIRIYLLLVHRNRKKAAVGARLGYKKEANIEFINGRRESRIRVFVLGGLLERL